jgi:hypothetical protein
MPAPPFFGVLSVPVLARELDLDLIFAKHDGLHELMPYSWLAIRAKPLLLRA